MVSFKNKTLFKLILIWIVSLIYPIYQINKKVLSVPNIIFYSTLAYLIILFIFWIVKKVSSYKIGKVIIMLIGGIAILFPLYCYIINDGIAMSIFGFIDLIGIIISLIRYFLKKSKKGFLEILLGCLCQMFMLGIAFIVWMIVLSMYTETILEVGIVELVLLNLIL